MINELAPSDDELMDIVGVKTPEPGKKMTKVIVNSGDVISAVEKSGAKIPKQF